MPNGGVPFNLTLLPDQSSRFYIECHGGTLQVLSREELQKPYDERLPMVKLEPHESAAIVAFMRYWIKRKQKLDVDDWQVETGATVKYEL